MTTTYISNSYDEFGRGPSHRQHGSNIAEVYVRLVWGVYCVRHGFLSPIETKETKQDTASVEVHKR